jgi:hypothetical protein
MMKKMIVTFFLTVMVFFTCGAPGLSPKIKQEQEGNVLRELKEIAQKREFDRFTGHVRLKESPDWTKVNQMGCMGWFQFEKETLKFLGYTGITPARFKKDPGIFPQELQIEAFRALLKSNEAELRNYMWYIGQVVNGIVITRSGLLAGAHLGGAMGVKLYLMSGGRINKRDVNGTSVEDYIREFKGYDI